MSCGHCKSTIEREVALPPCSFSSSVHPLIFLAPCSQSSSTQQVGKIEGVKSVVANHETKDVQVAFSDLPSSHFLFLNCFDRQVEFSDPATWQNIRQVLIDNEFPPENEREV